MLETCGVENREASQRCINLSHGSIREKGYGTPERVAEISNGCAYRIEPFHPQFHGGLLSLCVVVGIPALVGHNKLPHFILPSLMELDLESPAESGY